MRALYKYPLGIRDGAQPIVMRRDAKVVHVHWQDRSDMPEKVCLWAEVPLENPKETRVFVIHGTGQDIPDSEVYRGTAHDPRGFVWHVYEAYPD